MNNIVDFLDRNKYWILLILVVILVWLNLKNNLLLIVAIAILFYIIWNEQKTLA